MGQDQEGRAKEVGCEREDATSRQIDTNNTIYSETEDQRGAILSLFSY